MQWYYILCQVKSYILYIGQVKSYIPYMAYTVYIHPYIWYSLKSPYMLYRGI